MATVSEKTRKEIKKLKRQKHLSIREIAKQCKVPVEYAMRLTNTKYERSC